MSKLIVDECKRIIMQGKKQLAAAEQRIAELEGEISTSKGDMRDFVDSREKLEAELHAMEEWRSDGLYIETDYDEVLEWLDRQAAMTERECLERAAKSDWLGQHLHAVMAENRELQAKLDELTAERDDLQAANDAFTAKCVELIRDMLLTINWAMNGAKVGCGKYQEYYRRFDELGVELR